MADIFGVRVAPDLSILDSLIIICSDAGGQTDPAVLFMEQDYVVIWADVVAGARASALKALRVDPHGGVIGPAITFGTGNSLTDMAYDSNRCLVVWSNEHDAIYGRFLNEQAMPEDTVFMIDRLTGSEGSPQLDYGGVHYLIVWSDFDSAGIDREIYGRLVSTNGAIVSDRIQITDEGGHQACPSVNFNGINYLVAWIEASGAIKGRLIETSGQPASTIFQVCDTFSHARDGIDIASGLSNHLVVWSEWRSDFDIYGNCDISIEISEYRPLPEQRSWHAEIIGSPLPYDIYGHWEIFDVSGRKIPFESIDKGIYFLKNSEGEVHKIVKVR